MNVGVCKQSKTEIANVIIGMMMMMRRILMMMILMMMLMTVIKGKWASVNRGCGDRNSKHELSPHCNTQYTCLHLHLIFIFICLENIVIGFVVDYLLVDTS